MPETGYYAPAACPTAAGRRSPCSCASAWTTYSPAPGTPTPNTGGPPACGGGSITIDALLRLASEADIIPVVCNDAGGVLAYGRSRRLATPAQRRALALRDGGCSFPGCTAPASWTEAHHITAWINGGCTDLDGLTLLCGFHHREFEKLGWQCVMIDKVPHWVPPIWLDPDQVPIRNTAHHIEITFPAVA